MRLPLTPSTGRTVIIGLLGATELLLAGTPGASAVTSARRCSIGRPLTLWLTPHQLHGADPRKKCNNHTRRWYRYSHYTGATSITRSWDNKKTVTPAASATAVSPTRCTNRLSPR